MGFRDLFINDGNSSESKQVTEQVESVNTTTNKFPTSPPTNAFSQPTPTNAFSQPTPTNAFSQPTPTPTPSVSPSNISCAPHMEKIMVLYEKGFDGLNMDGYDFYEYFQAVAQTGINNPAMYNMALTMAKTMDQNVTKETLLNQSEYYITEINKVYQGYVDNGTEKKNSTLNTKQNEEQSLTNELTNINNEILKLNELKLQKEGELRSIDGKYAEGLTDIECKLMANDLAKNKIISTINTVVSGINNNL